MTIKIYTSKFSFTRDSRARWTCEELGVPYETSPVDLLGDRGDFVKLNPLGKVPFFVDGDIRMIESIAISLTLVEKYGKGALLPAEMPARAQTYQWLFHAASEVDGPMAQIFANTCLMPGREGAAQRAAEGRDKFAKVGARLNAHLSGSPYLVGQTFTLADIAVGTPLHWGALAGAFGDFPSIQSYYDRLAERPAFKKVFARTPGDVGFDGKA